MVKTFIPTSTILQKYVEVFYVFKKDIPERFSYIAFPHTNTAVSFFKGVKIIRKNLEVIIQSETIEENNYSIEILGKYTSPVFVHYNGAFEEIAIVFKPFGISQFIGCNLIDIAPKFSQSLNIEPWNVFSEQLFNEEDEKNRIDLIEYFLLANFNEIENKNISKALNYLEDINIDYTVEQIADTLAMNTKTFQRLFLKHITCSAIEYKRIARFRQSLNSMLLTEGIQSLTRVAYDNNYYDQSYFIREYKKLTLLNPKKFFDTISVMEENKIIWKIK